MTVCAADSRSCKCSINIPVGKYNKTGTERRNNFMFKTVGKIRRIQKAECIDIQRMSGFCLVDCLAHKRRTRPSRRNDAESFYFEPFF